jgi:leucyl aminopeptidase
MKLRHSKERYEKISCDILILGMFEKDQNAYTQHIDAILDKAISTAIKKKEFNGSFGELKGIDTFGKIMARKVIVAGLGKKKDYTLEQLRRVSAATLKAAKASGAKKVASLLHTFGINKASISDRVQASGEGALLGSYQFIQFKTQDRDKIKQVDDFIILEGSNVSTAINKAEIISNAVMKIRDLVNIPSNIVNPKYLAREAQKLKKLGVRVKVIGEKEAKRLGMNAFLAVGAGSENESQFVIMEYGSGKDSVAFVGKGITFDSGGLNLKPGRYMEDMKQDMAGAATTIAIMEAVAKLKLKRKVICAFAAAENMPSGKAYRPGDVITAYNKKTIEVMNTDAEGRMVLSDALAYIDKHHKPKVIIDLATLTGAVVVALGYWATGLLTKDDKLADELLEAGNASGDRVWRLPLWDEYAENMKSDVADVRNVGRSFDAGTIEAASFLSNFIDKAKWAHLDIAGTGWFTADKYYFSKGGTGAGLRLLMKWLEK